MGTKHNITRAADRLKKISIEQSKSEDLWNVIEERIDGESFETRNEQRVSQVRGVRRGTKFGQASAAVAAVALVVVGAPAVLQRNHGNAPSRSTESVAHDDLIQSNKAGIQHGLLSTTAPPQHSPVQLTVDNSQMTTDAGALSNIIKSSTIASHNFAGTTNTQAEVLTSAGGLGTLVAVNPEEQAKNVPASRLYLLTAKNQAVTPVASLTSRSDVISSAVLSQKWIAWTDFEPNGVTANIGIVDRSSGETWYVASSQTQQQLLYKALQSKLFIRGDSLFTYGMQNVYEYNMRTRKWHTFYSAPNHLSLLGFELTTTGAVVELSAGRSQSQIFEIDQNGHQVGPTYDLPQDALYTTGTSGDNVTLDGNNCTYMWVPGSSSIRKVSDTSSWLSGTGDHYLAGWGYVSSQKGQLIDLQNKRHYTFNANSAFATSNQLYWTKGNTVYWVNLPR